MSADLRNENVKLEKKICSLLFEPVNEHKSLLLLQCRLGNRMQGRPEDMILQQQPETLNVCQQAN